MEEKNVVEKRSYYCFYDVVANDYGEPFRARTNSEALRAFHISLSQQKAKGMIASEDDYKLFKMYDVKIFEEGIIYFFEDFKEIVDNEANNSEE